MIDFGAGWHLDLALKLALVLDLEGRDDSTRRSVPKQIKPLSVSAGHVITVFKFSQALEVLTDDIAGALMEEA